MPDTSLPVPTEPVQRIKPTELAAALRNREPVVIEGGAGELATVEVLEL